MARWFRKRRVRTDSNEALHDAARQYTPQMHRRDGSRNVNGEEASDDAIETLTPYRAILAFADRSHTRILIVAMAAAIIQGLAGPATALLTGRIFGALSGYRPGVTPSDQLINPVRRDILYLLAVAAGSFVFHFIFFTSWVMFGEQQAREARIRVFTALLHQEVAWFDRRKEGPTAMVPRLNAQIKDLQLACSQPLGGIVAIIANACFSFALAMYYSWKLTLVIMASIPIVLIFHAVMNIPSAKCGLMQQQKKTEALKVMSDALNTIDIVKCANAQDFERQRYMVKVREIATWFYKTVNINATTQGFLTFMAAALFVQAFYFGGVLVRSGEKQPGDIITTFLSALSVFTSLNSITAQLLIIDLGRIAGGKMQHIMAEVGKTATDVNGDSDDENYTPRTLFDNLKGFIEFQNVSFAYPNRRSHSVLSDFNIMLPLGSFSFIVGRSGSGKSTLGQLLTRLYDPGVGTISIAGFDVSHFNKKHIRRLAQLVEQSSTLFNDTVRENLLLGLNPEQRAKRDVYVELLGDAIDFALLRTFMDDSPNGLDTVVGQLGTSLSGGQRQRLALARARVRDAPILILDESTSALDTVNRDMIVKAIRHWRHGKTTIMITHSMNLISPDDYVYVVDGGTLVQEGYRQDIKAIDSRPPSPVELEKADSHHSDREDEASELIDTYLDRTAPRRPRLGTMSIALTNVPRLRFSTLDYNYAWMQSDVLSPTSDKSHSSAEWETTPDKRPDPLNSNPPRFNQSSDMNPFSGIRSVRDAQVSASTYVKRASTALSMATLRTVELTGLNREKTNVPYWQETKGMRLEPPSSPGSKQVSLLEDAPSETVVRRPPMTLLQIIKTVWPTIKWKQRLVLVLSFPTCAIHAVCSPITSLLTTRMIGTYSFGPNNTRMAMFYAIAIIGVAVAEGLTQYLQQMMFEYVGQNWINGIREATVMRILSQAREWYSREHNSTGRLVETLDRHADESRNVVGRFVPLYTIIIFTCLISVTWAMRTEHRLTLVTLAFLPIIFGITRIFSRVSSKWEGHSNDAAEKVNLVFIDTFTSIKTVKLLTAERQFQAKAAVAYGAAYDVGRRRALYTGFFYGLSEAASPVAQATIFYYAAVLATQGVSILDITFVLLMLIMAFTQITMILAVIPQASLARDATTRLFNLADLPLVTHEDMGDTRPSTIGDIEFRNVTFAYPTRPSPPALSDVSFTIPRGTYTAIIGASGSGKSTITALLTRLYSLDPSCGDGTGSEGGEPDDDWAGANNGRAARAGGGRADDDDDDDDDGRADRAGGAEGLGGEEGGSGGGGGGDILVSGRDITSHHTATLRSRLALVQQTTPLLSATVATNISYGLARPDPGVVRWAAAAAGAEDFIDSLPEGFDTLIGEGGLGLSGGQQQRVAIARALARRPDVLVLDEPTSALDQETMLGVRESLWRLRNERRTTVIVVTHERRMAEGADVVVVLEAGRVVEQGSYEGLMARRGGAMRRMWAGQQHQHQHQRQVHGEGS